MTPLLLVQLSSDWLPLENKRLKRQETGLLCDKISKKTNPFWLKGVTCTYADSLFKTLKANYHTMSVKENVEKSIKFDPLYQVKSHLMSVSLRLLLQRSIY